MTDEEETCPACGEVQCGCVTCPYCDEVQCDCRPEDYGDVEEEEL
jgi:hypothetical protein